MIALVVRERERELRSALLQVSAARVVALVLEESRRTTGPSAIGDVAGPSTCISMHDAPAPVGSAPVRRASALKLGVPLRGGDVLEVRLGAPGPLAVVGHFVVVGVCLVVEAQVIGFSDAATKADADRDHG